METKDKEITMESDTKCVHDPAVRCINKMDCFKCPLYEAIMRDYPH